MNKKNKGFTLIEAVLYLAIAGIILPIISGFAFNSIFGKSKIESVQDIGQSGQSVIDDINKTITDGVEINEIINL
jgi:type II secretory pathway pseudopilin PulG